MGSRCPSTKALEWKEKLVAFLEGMEVENIPMLLERGKVGDYRFLGQVMAQRTKDISKGRRLTPVAEVRRNLWRVK